MVNALAPLALDQLTGLTTEQPRVLSDLNLGLLIGASVLIVAIAAVRLSVRSGMPSLLIYLGLGVLIGEAGVLGIEFESHTLTQALGYAALVLILAEGGLTTRWSAIRSAIAPTIVLSTVGVMVSVAVIAALAHYVLGMPWLTAALVGAVLASTDAAAVFSVLRTVPLPRRITGMLEAESGFNDAPVVILVVAFAEMSVPGAEPMTWYALLGLAVAELAGGALIGLGVGWLGGQFMRRVAGGSSGLFSIGILALTVLAYALATIVHASGFIACYLAALVLGNLGLPHRAAVNGFATALGWLAQIGLFVLLGLLASPDRLLSQIVPALILGFALLLLARPLSVIVSTTPFGVPWRDQAFLSWAGLRGAVPVVLATVPLTLGAAGTEWLFDLVFVLVIIFTAIQAPTLPWVARRLGVIESVQALDVELESTPLEEIGAEVLQVTVGEESRLHGLELFELRLPPDSKVTLIVRGGEAFVPARITQLRRHDQLLIVTTAAHKTATVKRVIALSRDGRLAGWKKR